MNLLYSKSFIKAALKLSGKYKNTLQEKIKEVKVAESIEELTDCKKLTNFSNAYRIRIGDYRAFFILTVVNNTVNFEYLVNRGDAYNKEYIKNLRRKDKGKE
ncbi:MAG: hypothetical protein GZ094_16455 [Mariniphaga sp.]|nr:hypothetical protein [Mariniphaga sp.]